MPKRIKEEFQLLLHPTKENNDRIQKYPSWMRNNTRIREETDDRFTYITEKKVMGYGSLILGIFIGVQAAAHKNSWSDYLLYLIFTGVSAYFILWGLYAIMISKLVTIDKKSQSVIITKDSNIDFLKSVKKIPFSKTKKIEIRKHSHPPDGSDSWSINMIFYRGSSIKIYDTYCKSDAEGLAEKISKIIGCPFNTTTQSKILDFLGGL
jgi:hypothetical protein